MSGDFSSVYRGIVVNNVDPSNGGRVTLKVPAVLGNAVTEWATPSEPTPYIPDAGTIVLVWFEGGDVALPIFAPPSISRLAEDIEGLGKAGDTFIGSPPKAPAGLTLESTRVVSAEGSTSTRVTAVWAAVTENQDGSAPVKRLTGYRAQVSIDDGATWSTGQFVADPAAIFSNLPTGQAIKVRVQALSATSGPGLWSTVPLTTSSALTPPTPKVPTLAGATNSVRITFGWADDGNVALPKTVARVEIERAPTNAFASVTVVGSMLNPGTYVDTAITPGTEYFYRLVAVSREGLRGATSVAASATPTVDPTADLALQSANGKNRVTFSTNAPTANDANAAGDTWFQRDADGNLIGQYEGMGGTTGAYNWNQRLLSHQTMSSLDLGKATVGRLSAGKIDAGEFSSDYSVSGRMVAGVREGARLEFDAEGLRQYDAAGAQKVVMDPVDGVSIEGSLVADDLTIRDRFALRGVNNEVAKGSRLYLSTGTTAPTSAPTVSAGYEQYDGDISVYLFNTRGFHHESDGSGRYLVTNFFSQTQMYSPTGKYTFPANIKTSDGNSRSEWDALSHTVVVVGGAKRFVGVGYKNAAGASGVSGFRSYDLSTLVGDGSVAPVKKAEVYPSGMIGGSYISDHRVGRCISPAANLSSLQSTVAHAWTNYGIDGGAPDYVRLSLVTVTDSAITPGSYLQVVPPYAEGEGTSGVGYGSSARMGFPGADRNVWLLFTNKWCYVYATNGTRIPDFEFPMAPGADNVDLCGSTDAGVNGFVGFRSAPNYQASHPEVRWVTKYTNNHWLSTTSSKWWVSTTWFDPDPASPIVTDSTHETAQSPRSVLVMKKRAGLLVTAPPFPARPDPTTTDDVLAAKVYVGLGETDPGRTNMEYQTTLTSPTRAILLPNPTIPTGAAALPPPATSNFPTSTPARIVSADGAKTIIAGDGTTTLQGSTFSDQGVTITHATGDVKMRNNSGSASVTTSQDGAIRETGGVVNTTMRPVDSGYRGASVAFTTSTEYTTGPSVVFTAPPSGVVVALVEGYTRSDTAGKYSNVTAVLRTGGTAFSGTEVEVQVTTINEGQSWIRGVGFAYFSNLTPGSTYNIGLRGAVTPGATATISQSRILLLPSS